LGDSLVMPLFGTPLYIREDVFFDDRVNEYLKSYEYERMDSKNGDYTKDKYILEKPEIIDLKKVIQNSIDDFVFNQLHVAGDVQFYITNSWAVKHSPGDWAQFHLHTNCLLSGVYYFDVKEDQGDLTFTSDYGSNTGIFPININLTFKENNIFNSKKWWMKPRNGNLYIFPSWLLHSVGENKTQDDRYSLAFNVHLKGKIGEKEYELEIK